LAIDTGLDYQLRRIREQHRIGASRSRFALLIALPALTALCSHLYYQETGFELIVHVAGSFFVGGALLLTQWLAGLGSRSLIETLSAPGEVLDFVLSPDRGFVFFNREGCFLEKTKSLWTYDGPRVRIFGVSYETDRHLFRLQIAGIIAGGKAGFARWVDDEMVVHLPVTYEPDRARGLLDRIQPLCYTLPQTSE